MKMRFLIQEKLVRELESSQLFEIIMNKLARAFLVNDLDRGKCLRK